MPSNFDRYSPPPFYHDREIEIDDAGITIRRYNLFQRNKRILFEQIKHVIKRQPAHSGRTWGPSDWGCHHWYPWNPQRRSRAGEIVLDLGKHVQPVITPDDPDRVEAVLRERTLSK